MTRFSFKKALPDLLALLVFLILAIGYFIHPISEGLVLNQHDSLAGIGAGQEAKIFRETTHEITRWTNSTFGGMPTYQISPSYNSTNLIKQTQHLFDWYLPAPANLIFMMLIGFYLLLRVLSINPVIAVLGAIAYTFSSYFFIIIQAGHIWKFITLCYIPPTIAGVILSYKGKYWAGGLLTAFFLTMQILSNHIQMSYYFGFVILLLALTFLVEAIRKKELLSYFKSSITLLIATLIAIAANLSTLYHTYEYSKHTMRGKSELQQNVANHTDNGLEKDYIVQWSYGIGETLSLLIPNINGGASEPLSANEEAMQKALPQFKSIYNYFTQYFGSQPMTSGPVYVGAFIITLFIMGLFLVKGPVKNALVIATLLSILLAWGKNFMPFTDFFLEYVPMYNKFRAVSSMLVVAEFTIPLLAILCIKKIYDHPEILKEKQKWVLASIGITGGLCLLIALLPEWFIPSFTSENDQQIVAAIMQQVEGGNASQVGNSLINNLTEMRIPFVTGDAWRSFFIIVIGSAMLLSIRYFKVKPQWAVVAITLLCLFDMGKVNKRYLNDQHFVAPRNVTQTLTPSEADKIILQDKDPNFRVLNFTTSTFNDPITSYFHKSVGGYHAAKLRRYQDLIENYISPEMNNFIQSMVKSGKTIESLDEEQFKIINMLNTKYFIVGGKQGNKIPITNPYAYGNAWFVNNIHYTDTPDQEIASLQTQNLRETAVIDKQFAPAIKQKQYTSDSLAYIKLTQYQPNKLVYESQASTPQLAVFSEIFYQDGWKAYVDGGEIPIVRANYLLRATEIPAGKHSIEFRFDPLSIHITESIAYGAIVLLLISILAFFAYNLRKKEARN